MVAVQKSYYVGYTLQFHKIQLHTHSYRLQHNLCRKTRYLGPEYTEIFTVSQTPYRGSAPGPR